MKKAYLAMAVVSLGIIFLAAKQEHTDVPRWDALTQTVQRIESDIRRGKLKNVSMGTVITMNAYIEDAKRVAQKNPSYAKNIAKKVAETTAAAKKDRDILAEKRGLLWRGYESPYSLLHQIYSVYVPPTYDGKKSLPLVVTLHGGSSNHNVWLSKMLGNGIPVATYKANFRTEYKSQIDIDAIVVAPDGLGQIRWRWMGAQDIFDVIEDVKKNYNIDDKKVFLTGLSNGGIGAYTVGLKYAWKFAAILPLAGITSWVKFIDSGGNRRPSEKTVLINESAITYAENAFNTHLRFFHGFRDPGFKVEQARLMTEKLVKLGVPFLYKEIPDLGHDLSHILWRDLSINKIVKEISRKEKPAEVRLVTATERANRQFWVVLDDRIDHTQPGRIHARVHDKRKIDLETENVSSLTLLLKECPINKRVTLHVDKQDVFDGDIPKKRTLSLQWETKNKTWKIVEHYEKSKSGTRKVAGLSGPLGDANYEKQVHVYGSKIPEDIAKLHQAAELGARAWMIGKEYSEVRQPVIRDTELTEEIISRRIVVLYGNAKNNSVMAKIGHKLPIQVGDGYIQLGAKKLTDVGIGARFICPNPMRPESYIVIKAGNSAEAVLQGARQLPIYMPDYVVYDSNTTKVKSHIALGKRPEIELGFFTEDWKLSKVGNDAVSTKLLEQAAKSEIIQLSARQLSSGDYY